MKTNITLGLIIAMLLITVLAAGCAPAATPVINVDGAWGMPSMSYPTAGAVFMVIKNTGTAPDKLLSGTSPACGSIEVHEMIKKADGTMGMNLVDKPVEIAPSGQVELKSGGLHIMCINKNDQFKPGTKIDLTLKFEKAGDKTISLDVRSQ